MSQPHHRPGEGTLLRAYRALLRLYPRRVRERVGDDMVEVFQDLTERARAKHGRWGLAGVVVRTLAELPLGLVRAHRAGRTDSRRGGDMMGSLWQDVRFAARGLRKSAGFTALAVLSLGIGVGANTAMFGMIASTLWSELPVEEPDRLVRLHEVRESPLEVSYPNFQDAAEQVDLLAGAFMHRLETFALVAGELSHVLHGELVTSSYFDVLGIEPAWGALIDPARHDAPESEPVVVLSHWAWTELFAADPSVVGRAVELNGYPFTVIGIAPESFHGTKFGLSLDLWVPVRQWAFADRWPDGWDQRRGDRSLQAVARLADGATLDGANAALATLSERLADEYPLTNAGMTLRVTPEVAGQIAPGAAALPNMIGLLAVFGSGLVLLVACGNVASLLLARAVARRQEIAVRVAMGAGRGRLVRQLLTESVLLAGMGAVAGLGLAAWVSRFDGRLLPNIPYRFSIDTSPDAQTMAYAVAASLLAVLAFGLAPALQASKAGVAAMLRGDDRAGGLRVPGARMLDGVVVGVVSLSFLTLFLAGLFTTSLAHVRTIDPGFARDGRVLATLDMGLAGYDMGGATRFYDELVRAVEAVPGVAGAAVTGGFPMGDFSSSARVFAEDREYGLDAQGVRAWYAPVSADWLEVAGVRLLAGRGLREADDASAPPVVVVNEALARLYWPDQDPLGRSLRVTAQPGGTGFEVVGVVETGRYMSMVEPPSPAMYFSMAQRPRTQVVLVASTDGEPATLIGPIREAVRALDPSVVLYDVKTIDELMSNANWVFRLGAELGIAIGLVAAALAAGGLYGIMVFRVGRRRREMGIRIALGAGGAEVFRHVLAGSARLVGVGVALGCVLALATSGVMESIVFGVEPRSFTHFAGVGLALTLLAVAATLAPALAATRADPVQAIKTE